MRIFLLNILWYFLGKNLHKYLKSMDNYETTMDSVERTFLRLVEVQTEDEIVTSSKTIGEYKFFKSHIFDVLCAKYVVLNEGFLKSAVNHKTARIGKGQFKSDEIENFITSKFNEDSLFTKKTPEATEKANQDRDNAPCGKIMLPSEWNAFWEEIIKEARAEKTLENLSCKPILLSQLPGVRAKHDEVEYLLNLKSETEYPIELAIVLNYSGDAINLLSQTKYEWEPDELNELFDVHSYLFGDI